LTEAVGRSAGPAALVVFLVDAGETIVKVGALARRRVDSAPLSVVGRTLDRVQVSAHLRAN
jgi:hypothetical protein